MSYRVTSLLERARSRPATFSALDAVMGEDWAIVDAGRARRGRTPGMGLRAIHAADVRRGLAGGMVPGRKPQAVVKMVRKGGASDVRGLKAQIAYLSRDGAQPLQRSEAFDGIEIDADQMASIEKGWRMPPEGSGRADRTSHFIVSFPEDSVHASAQRAGRAWAEEMFGSGNYGGDSYDYYTAFHTDRAHPHMHVVVHRRGLENEEWLKVSQRSDMNYDMMREVLVDVAGREGIELEATSRLARGIHDRPVPDAEYRSALNEDRNAVPPEHSQETAIRAAAALIHFSRQFAADALAIERDLPDQAAILRSISENLAEGREITIRDYDALSSEGEKQMADRLEEVTEEVRGKFQRLDGDVMDVDDNATRMKLLRQIAELKETTVPLMRDPGELSAFAQRDDSGRFESFAANDPLSEQVKSVADEVARDVARDYGVDEGATLERYAGPTPSRGLARQFEEAEERERGETRARNNEGPESIEERAIALDRMRNELQNVYREGRNILQERYALMDEFREEISSEGRDDELVGQGMRLTAGMKAEERERLSIARESAPEIVESTPWTTDSDGTQLQYFAAKTERGFHPGVSRAPRHGDEMETEYSSVAVSTPEEATRLAYTFNEQGDRGVRDMVAQEEFANRQLQDERPSQEPKMTPEQKLILRDLERDTDDFDR